MNMARGAHKGGAEISVCGNFSLRAEAERLQRELKPKSGLPQSAKVTTKFAEGPREGVRHYLAFGAPEVERGGRFMYLGSVGAGDGKPTHWHAFTTGEAVHVMNLRIRSLDPTKREKIRGDVRRVATKLGVGVWSPILTPPTTAPPQKRIRVLDKLERTEQISETSLPQ